MSLSLMTMNQKTLVYKLCLLSERERQGVFVKRITTDVVDTG